MITWEIASGTASPDRLELKLDAAKYLAIYLREMVETCAPEGFSLTRKAKRALAVWEAAQ